MTDTIKSGRFVITANTADAAWRARCAMTDRIGEDQYRYGRVCEHDIAVDVMKEMRDENVWIKIDYEAESAIGC